MSPTMPAWLRPRHALRRRRPFLRTFWGRIAVLALFAGAAFVAARLDPLPPPLSGAAQAADGDSLRLAGDRIRLLGIDAPELDQTCTDADGAAWRCGEVARRRLAALVANAGIECLPAGHDRYGRTLATCTADGRDVASVLVAEGLAVSYPDYTGEEASARRDRRGIWVGPFVTPRQWRDGDREEAARGPVETAWDWFRELTGARSLR